eukprot:CAMPEP_0180664516 /NCGR_PEP_ID=MMETSP1037_2-20121125/60677_1 /TAXON_ID=632150 /ORGANISM="Azadinium spinosum, Strain 3D9" /LENGTH=40 /DNA_ID= /DNA_START= /DNA_END= /DNA_ORIENTATION=
MEQEGSVAGETQRKLWHRRKRWCQADLAPKDHEAMACRAR